MEGNSTGEKITKKPFDKRKWRENKYDNKLKVQKWQDRKEKAMKMKYFRMLNKESSKNPNMVPLGNKGSDGSSSSKPGVLTVKKAKEEFERRQKAADRKTKKEEKHLRILEAQERRKEFMKKRSERQKVFRSKTTKGQPMMAGRMELLYKRILANESS